MELHFLKWMDLQLNFKMLNPGQRKYCVLICFVLLGFLDASVL
ncbi:hypothetical protein Gotri_015273 [Gossypium trilobum]|uniref:Uncharacterized protein n=1 Tax=Gossypium trilobum TaxID=34281 RepID=A0A7J9DZU7_9ROSI|nr:hypothetical protein [Gossypium trilobum]